MIRIFITIVIFLGLASGFVWLAEHPGAVSVVWFNKQIETSLMAFAVMLSVLIVGLMALAAFLRGVWRSPRVLRDYFSARRRDKGYQALSSGMIAVGSGDVKKAEAGVLEAQRLLKKSPLTLLLKAQTAQLAGNHELARETFHAMLKDDTTRLLGLRGLFMEAERLGESEAALQLAEMAVEEASRLKGRSGVSSGVLTWAGHAVLRYQCAAEDWEEALKTIANNAQAGLIDRKEARHKRAVVLVASALKLEDGSPQEAKLAVLEAHKLAPELVPAGVVAGRVLARLGELRRAAKILETVWKHSPHPEIASVYAQIRPGDGPHARVKRIKALARLSPEHIESAIALAKAAVEAGDWATAREALAPHLKKPAQRVCLLMADLEEAEHGDKGRVRQWLAKAVYAAPDPAWVADGVISDHWAPVSPISGELDAYEWIIPANTQKAEALTLDENDVLLKPPVVDEPKPAAWEASIDEAAAPAETAQRKGEEAAKQAGPLQSQIDSRPGPVHSAPEKLPEEKPQEAPQKPDQGKEPSSQTSGGKAPDAVASPQSALKPEILSADDLPRAPDDPGLDDRQEEDVEKRFRLFD